MPRTRCSRRKKTIWVRSAAQGNAELSKLKANRTYYVRVRAYADAGGSRSYSAWSSRACAQSKQRALSKLKIRKKAFEIRSAARQKVYGYDTLQGSCSDGFFGYFALYNRTKENCKIVKVRLSDGAVAKVSGALDVVHGKKKRVKAIRKKKVRVVKVKYAPYTRLLRDNYLYRI